jgi:hypothetical protein
MKHLAAVRGIADQLLAGRVDHPIDNLEWHLANDIWQILHQFGHANDGCPAVNLEFNRRKEPSSFPPVRHRQGTLFSNRPQTELLDQRRF